MFVLCNLVVEENSPLDCTEESDKYRDIIIKNMLLLFLIDLLFCFSAGKFTEELASGILSGKVKLIFSWSLMHACVLA